MEAAIRKAISEFDGNPMLSARAMRALFENDHTGFFERALPVLRNSPDSQGYNYLLTLLHSEGLLLKTLCNPDAFTLEQSKRIAHFLLQVDAQFDVRLLRSLVQNNGNTSVQELEHLVGTAVGIRLLDLLGEISDGTRILPTMTQLLGHSNSHIRSKAALLVGRSNKNHKWVQERLGETDARVRANAVESLWGADSAGSRAVFWAALGDDDNRVVGNAALGLYRLGDPASVRVILQLLSHPEAGFRVTAVWVMGETGDPRFIPILSKIISEPVAELRGSVFRAIAKLKKAVGKRNGAPPVHVFMGPARQSEDGWVEFTAGLRCHPGKDVGDLNSTNFAIWEDSVLTREYTVRQRGKHEPLAIALAVPRLLDRKDPAQGIQETAVERALRHKRRIDVWMVLKYVSSEPPKKVSLLLPVNTSKHASALGISAAANAATAVMTPGDEDLSTLRMRFTTNPDDIEDAVASPGTRLGCASDARQAVRALGSAIGQVRAARNIIFLCQSQTDKFAPETLDEVRAMETGAAIHVISPWPDATMQELCSRTGGMLLTPSPDQMPEALEGLCASLLNSYEVRYRPENPAASKIRLQVYSDSVMGEGLQNLA